MGRYGDVVVADRYESYDAWKAVAAVGAGIAIGTMLAKPPAAATPVVGHRIDLLLSRQRVLHARDEQWSGRLPGRRASRRRDHRDAPGQLQERPSVGNATYTQCGPTYYTRVSTGYQVVVLK